MAQTNKPTPTKQVLYELTLSLDKKYTAKGDDFNEVLDDLKQKSFGMIRSWGVFMLKTGSKKSEYRYSPIQIKRVFAGGFARKLLLERLSNLLK